MDKQYLDKDGLEVVRDKIDEARQVAAGAMGLAQSVGDSTSITNTLINSLFNPTKRIVGSGVRKFLYETTGGDWTHTATVTGVYEMTFFKHLHGNTVSVSVNGTRVASCPFWGTDSSEQIDLDQDDISWTTQVYVKKGDVIRAWSDNASTDGNNRWFFNHYSYWGIE